MNGSLPRCATKPSWAALLPIGLIAGVALVLVPPAAAQTAGAPVTVDVSVGFAEPTGRFTGSPDAGIGYTVVGSYPLTSAVSFYTGYTRNHFNLTKPGFISITDTSFPVVSEYELTDAGFVLGSRLVAPADRVTPWIAGGVIVHRTRSVFSPDRLAIATTSHSSAGFEVGGGMNVRIGRQFSFGPGFMYRRHSPRGPHDARSEVSYVRYDLTARFALR